MHGSRPLLCPQIADLALSKRQYESNFQKDNSMNQTSTVTKVQAEKVLFPVPMKERVADTRAWKPKRDKFSGLTRRAKRRKLASEGETREERRATDAAIRSAKKAARPAKIGVPKEPPPGRSTSKHKAKGDRLGKAGFGHDQGSRGSRREGIRAKRGDVAKIKGKGRK